MADEFVYIPDVVPVFPLPEVVLFPGTLLPLHIFEPRYRQMMADTLAGEHVIATALLKPGFEPLYYTRQAPIYGTIAIGQIVGSEQVADGNYNLLLRGFARATIDEELTDHDYRLARITPVETYCSRDESRSETLRKRLFAAICTCGALAPKLRRQWSRLHKADVDLDDVCDLIAGGLPVEADLRQSLLDEADAYARAKLLLLHLNTLTALEKNRRQMYTQEGRNLN